MCCRQLRAGALLRALLLSWKVCVMWRLQGATETRTRRSGAGAELSCFAAWLLLPALLLAALLSSNPSSLLTLRFMTLLCS